MKPSAAAAAPCAAAICRENRKGKRVKMWKIERRMVDRGGAETENVKTRQSDRGNSGKMPPNANTAAQFHFSSLFFFSLFFINFFLPAFQAPNTHTPKAQSLRARNVRFSLFARRHRRRRFFCCWQKITHS